ncbi:hypothetical protein KR032_010483 [Drosophila birchii]|nr:hypothetical protein KR032_010483 [Drosophila birchii]
MESTKLFMLLIGMCCLSPIRQAQAECCTSSEEVMFFMKNGVCEAVGAERHGSACRVNICADGVAIEGTFCGRGPCNIFGCNCDGGCLTGEWSKSFQEKNQQYGIKILEVERSPS